MWDTHKKAFEQLLIVDQLRGRDSTGLAAIQCNDETSIVKRVGDPSNLFDSRAYNSIMAKNNRVLIGHNRYATQGATNQKNAHPFAFDNIIGVHNGTLSSKHKFKDGSKFDVDSEAFFNHINEEGIHSSMEHIQGAWSIVFWNKEEQTLNFLRNAERPMYIAATDTGGQIFWASEAWMLEVIIPRHNIKIGEIITTPIDTLFTIKIGQHGAMDKPVAKKMPSRYVEVKHPNYYGGRLLNGPNASDKSSASNVSNINSKKEVETASSKKSVVESSSSKNTLNEQAKYLQTKQRLMEVLTNDDVDPYGAQYCTLFDEENPYVEIRLYYRKDGQPPVASFLYADISSFVSSGLKEPRSYYKVSPWSFNAVKETFAAVKKVVHACSVCSESMAEGDVFGTSRQGDKFCSQQCINFGIQAGVSF